MAKRLKYNLTDKQFLFCPSSSFDSMTIEIKRMCLKEEPKNGKNYPTFFLLESIYLSKMSIWRSKNRIGQQLMLVNVMRCLDCFSKFMVPNK